MEKWVLGYGHSSVAEGAIANICLEGVSILATKVIEDNRLSSFIEKSTRYVSFDENSFYLDKKLMNSKYSEEIKEYISFLFKTYMELHEPVLESIKKCVPIENGVSKAAWERACAARRFDAIRYILPTATKTSLGWTVNARQLSHAIKKLLSHPLNEMQDIGLMLKEEGSKVLPSLLRFADKNEYFEKTEIDMQKLANTIIIEKEMQDKVTLVDATNNPEDKLISAILYRYKENSFEKVSEKVKSLSNNEKEKIFDTFLKNMGKFDYPLRELEHIDFTFEIIMDYGAFRDLQRHRICTQTNPIFTAELGYEYVKDIEKAGVLPKYKEAMEKAKKLYDKISKDYPLEAQYLLPLGYRKRFLITMNLREIHHLIKVRSTPLAHESYRIIAYKLYEIMKNKYPLLSKYIECNYTEEELGRLKSEEATEKLDKVGPL
jgi:thymidylate synthase ThyX